jgi:hypothetical protein
MVNLQYLKPDLFAQVSIIEYAYLDHLAESAFTNNDGKVLKFAIAGTQESVAPVFERIKHNEHLARSLISKQKNYYIRRLREIMTHPEDLDHEIDFRMNDHPSFTRAQVREEVVRPLQERIEHLDMLHEDLTLSQYWDMAIDLQPIVGGLDREFRIESYHPTDHIAFHGSSARIFAIGDNYRWNPQDMIRRFLE